MSQRLSLEEVVEWSRRIVCDWVAQSNVSPIPAVREEGFRFHDAAGKDSFEFNNQLMCPNIGHGDPHALRAISRQAEQPAYSNSAATTTGPGPALPQARLVNLGGIEKGLCTLAEANEEPRRLRRYCLSTILPGATRLPVPFP